MNSSSYELSYPMSFCLDNSQSNFTPRKCFRAQFLISDVSKEINIGAIREVQWGQSVVVVSVLKLSAERVVNLEISRPLLLL